MQEDVIRRGRSPAKREKEVEQFLSSMDADRNIANADVLVDIAHLLMLRKQEIIDHGHAAIMLNFFLELYRNGIPEEAFSDHFEDIHAGIEALLISSAGEKAGGRLHIGRSRNDEVATCIRIELRSRILRELELVNGIRRVLLQVAENHRDSVMPGFTHFQHAQPTTLAHYMLSYEQAFSRDFQRLNEAYARVNLCPLGSAAFASTGYRIDRDYTARILGFDGIVHNTMDAVASRDFALEVLSALTIMMTTASRVCEELVLWSSSFIRFVDLDEQFCSTSSIMPQKKNPDTVEIMRAKTGSVAGAYAAALVIMKGLPMSYNRDLQELTPHLWKGTREAGMCLELLEAILASARFDTCRMEEESGRGLSTATDLADFLVRQYDQPFRTAHSIVARAAQKGTLDIDSLDQASREITGKELSGLGLTDPEIARALSVRDSIRMRDHPGGPAPSATAEAIALARATLSTDQKTVRSRRDTINKAIDALVSDAGRSA